MFENISKNNCPCGREHSFTSEVLAERGAIKRLPDILTKMGIRSAFIIADKNTYSAAGKNVEDALKSADIKIEKYVFDKDILKPNEENVGLAAMSFSSQADAVVGVGSGVINDICKIIASVAQKPYIIVATAPSMDGYASATSSMSMDGLKISLNSKCADVIVGDLDVLCNAPVKMMLSGLGDMIAKYVSICEWRISNLINGEYYCENIASLVKRSLKRCIDNADGLLRGDEAAVKAVFEGLIICGAAMKFAGLSRPASGIEHYLSHIWDMRGVEFGTPVELHGIQCAVGTLISVKLYEKLKNIIPDKEKALSYVSAFDFISWTEDLKRFLGKGAESMIALEEKEQKYSIEKHSQRIEIIIEKWNEILSIIEEELPSLPSLEALFDKLSLPKNLECIGLGDDILAMSFMCAKDIRDKYVLPRLAWDLGIINELFKFR